MYNKSRLILNISIGLLIAYQDVPDMCELNETTAVRLTRVPYEKLYQGSAALAKLQEDFR
jgi:hypothetical protein